MKKKVLGKQEKFDPIPETVEEALKVWDSGESLFAVEMGGLGPGYEMAIQGLAFEMMREGNGFNDWEDKEKRDDLQKRFDGVVHRLADEPWAGFSGAQVGAAQNIACCVLRNGYRIALRKPEVKDRLIQVSKKDLRGVR